MIRPVTEKDIPACGYLQMPLPKITEERQIKYGFQSHALRNHG